MTTFHEHLLASTGRPDALGDLARDYQTAIETGAHEAVNNHHELHAILTRRHAPQEAHDAVDALHHDHDRDCLCGEI